MLIEGLRYIQKPAAAPKQTNELRRPAITLRRILDGGAIIGATGTVSHFSLLMLNNRKQGREYKGGGYEVL